MKNRIKNRILLLALSATTLGVHAQNTLPKDTTEVTVKSGDRNVMLNAEAANAGPRNVNIGLPAAAGGTTVLENGLPVVIFTWPEMPYKVWRSDAMINQVNLLNIGQTAIELGDVGFSVNTYNNLGTDIFQGNVGINSNHFGLLNGTGNISGPLNKNGLKYSVGAFVNFDPGTYSARKNNIDRYYADQTQIYKAALTQDYRTSSVLGSVSLFYKFTDTKSIGRRQYAPYHYHLDGSVSEIDGFKIGSDNYTASQKFRVMDAATGQLAERDMLKDYGTTSHTIDIIGKNRFNNGLFFNYNVKLHSAKSGHYAPVMTGVNEAGDVQNVMILGSKKTPIKNISGLFEVGKKSGRHEWKVGLDQWLYDIDKFTTEGVIYSQNIQPNPTIIDGSERDYKFEYHNGKENNTAIFVIDKWDISSKITLNAGMRLEYMSLRGDYINNRDVDANVPYLSSPKSDIKKDWFRKAFMIDGVFKLTRRFGFLAEASYNEQYGHLENYSAGNDPNIKRASIPVGGVGIYYNHPQFSVVSKATYIKRDEYRSTINFTSASQSVARHPVEYGIETLGWTTDVVATPFKNFNLHFLLTIQAPKYKDYSGTVTFETGEQEEFNFNDKIVNGIPKVLIEIDPSYQWNDLRVWASARYFSKTYANLTNSLFFEGRWETFAGANYKIGKNLEVSATVVNLLNQRGAQGTISGADLWTQEDIDQGKIKDGQILSGTYIRPFTVEFGLKYKF